MASTNNAENFMKIARIVYQLCDYTDFRADCLQTIICGKWLVFANQVTYYSLTMGGAWVTERTLTLGLGLGLGLTMGMGSATKDIALTLNLLCGI